MRINYIIATWNGRRVKPAVDMIYYKKVLNNHIKQINNVRNNISQITIMKPLSKVNNSYYDIPEDNRIQIVDCENKYFSYGQWLTALKRYVDDFDYHILIEDDYVPACDNFDEKLIDLYEEGTYLCSLAGDDKSFNLPFHCRISNGIISSKTIKKIIKTVDFNDWFDSNYQLNFSKYLLDNNIGLKDYKDEYRVTFFSLGNIIDYSCDSENNYELITPIQNIVK